MDRAQAEELVKHDKAVTFQEGCAYHCVCTDRLMAKIIQVQDGCDKWRASEQRGNGHTSYVRSAVHNALDTIRTLDENTRQFTYSGSSFRGLQFRDESGGVRSLSDWIRISKRTFFYPSHRLRPRNSKSP
jgi:hypothetical protein